MTYKPPYKASSGNWYTMSLFREIRNQSMQARIKDTHPVVFSLHGDYPGLINCRTTFVELRDPTGYKWAMKYLGDLRHWNVLMKIDWFKEAFVLWNQELTAQLRSEALGRIIEIAGSDTSQALAAAKYVAEEGWTKETTRGRPSKIEVDAKLKQEMKKASAVDEDAERIGLRLVKG